jgi:fatty acid desaturase
LPDPKLLLSALIAIIVTAVLNGIGDGVRSGVSKRVSSLIAKPTRPRRKKRRISWIKVLVLFLVLTALIYAVFKAWPLLMALI